MNVIDETARQRIDEALRKWRQGDCVLGDHWFLFQLNANAPLTEEAATAAEAGADAGEAQVCGFMVAIQTCDIVRACANRPFVEVCPLVEVEKDKLEEIRSARRPNYAFLPGVSDQKLVADLDRVMTVEKSLVAIWDRIDGCRNDHEVRRLALALERKRCRVAFPDDFVVLASKLTQQISSKHGKESDQGRALRALREIRVRAAPSWNADDVEITFCFIRHREEPSFEKQGWDHWLDAWLKRVPAGGRFTVVDGLVQTLDDLSARDYVDSDQLDLDHLTVPRE